MKDGKIFKFNNVFYTLVNGVVMMKVRLGHDWKVSGMNAHGKADVKHFCKHVAANGELVAA